MKTLILYATKYGAAGEIAKRVAGQIEGAVVHDLKQPGVPSLNGFDCIIVGSSLYAGMIRKEAKAFLSQNADILKKKKLGLFLSGIDTSKGKGYFESAIPGDVLQAAKATAFLGGIFDPKKAAAMEKLIMKAVTKKAGYVDAIDDDKIRQFVEEIKA
jgi:menaquinone-dependent protoporphyrinogen oxidase